MNQTTNIDPILSCPKFKQYQELGLIDEIAVRNLLIRKEYILLRKTLSTFDSIVSLSEKHNLSESAINSIVFRKRYKKKVVLVTK